jgi:hypothetical protein
LHGKEAVVVDKGVSLGLGEGQALIKMKMGGMLQEIIQLQTTGTRHESNRIYVDKLFL